VSEPNTLTPINPILDGQSAHDFRKAINDLIGNVNTEIGKIEDQMVTFEDQVREARDGIAT